MSSTNHFPAELFSNGVSLGKYLLVYDSTALGQAYYIVTKTTPSVDDIILGSPILTQEFTNINAPNVNINFISSAKYFNNIDLNNYKFYVNIDIYSVFVSITMKGDNKQNPNKMFHNSNNFQLQEQDKYICNGYQEFN